VIYAAPDKPPHWIDAIASLKNEAVRSALIEKGHARAQKFSWKSSAEAYLRAMALIDADSYPRPRASDRKKDSAFGRAGFVIPFV
jgi:hypothetical protein